MKIFLAPVLFICFTFSAQNAVIMAKNSVIHISDIDFPFPEKVIVSSSAYEVWDLDFKGNDSTYEYYTLENKQFFASLGEDTSLMEGTWTTTYQLVYTFNQTVQTNELFSFDFMKNIFTYQNDVDRRLVKMKITNVSNDENFPEDSNCFLVWLEDDQGNMDSFALNLKTNTIVRNGTEGVYTQQRFVGAEVRQVK